MGVNGQEMERVSEQRHFLCRAEAVVNGVARGEGLTVAQAICMLVRHFASNRSQQINIFIMIYWICNATVTLAINKH